jgi:hypothetical protein
VLLGYIRTILNGVSSETHSDGRCLFTEATITEVVQGCLDLQEISIKGWTKSDYRPAAVSPLCQELLRLIYLSLLHRLILGLPNTYNY